MLFLDGDFDQICTIAGHRQCNPMRAACPDLTVIGPPAAHRLPLERKAEHIQAIGGWLEGKTLT